ncbi:PDZ domain-containing protein [Roseibacterium sp. SDUM158017]|uniref:PDZ domain-containing protein n=1 Tax=Roseicyclus salinarum TaxID=3036773 RepID=UPI00241537D5|nr:PDZ domain-containing protein [Roseibacterium sp. SDUM158017]MDG4647792.1 PDZ domain-containing protein [Roseibacterium sp. SDUM158017]
MRVFKCLAFAVLALGLLARAGGAQIAVGPLGEGHGDLEGVVIMSLLPDCELALGDLQLGDVITHINKQSISSPEEFEARMAAAPTMVAFTVRRDSTEFRVVARRVTATPPRPRRKRRPGGPRHGAQGGTTPRTAGRGRGRSGRIRGLRHCKSALRAAH